MGRVSRRLSRWLRIQPILRTLHSVGRTFVAGNASAAPCGERLFVDYAGHTVDVICPETGEVRTAQIFVAALGTSNLTYVEATWTQSLPDWISSHVRAFAFLGGVPAQVVPDNLKAAVIKACFHDPAINRTYGDMAAHYDTAAHLRGLANRRTRRRSRARCCWPRAGYWPACATRHSSAWMS